MTAPPVIEKPRKHKLFLRILLVLCVIACLVIVGFVGLVGRHVYMAGYVIKPNAYAMDYAHLSLIEHMRMNDGAWPQSWEELSNTCASSDIGLLSSNPEFVIKELAQRVEIDWASDPGQLLTLVDEGKSLEGRLVRLRSGRRDWFVGSEPNQMIYEYL